MKLTKALSRREFLKAGGAGLGAVALRPWLRSGLAFEFPDAARLGRVTTDFGESINLRAKPSTEAAEVGVLYGDEVVPCLRETVGYTPYRNQRWVETPKGYAWSPLIQPVKNHPNKVLDALPPSSTGNGMWVEVTVPYVNVRVANAVPISPRVKFLVEENLPVRLYYGQIIWADDIRQTDDGVEYHVRELHGSYGDHYWGEAKAFRPIQPEDMSPISPDIEDKSILINLARQTLSCFEEGREVFFCRISSGRDKTKTPTGDYLRIFWKLVSVHMTGGTTGAGYDLTGVAWPTFIAAGGIAIHGTFWHNNFGERTSAGCVNVLPEDAKFISRWSNPSVPYDPGVVDVGGTSLGTKVRVVEE